MIVFSLICLSVSCSKDNDSNSSNNSGGSGSEDLPDSFITLNVTGDETGQFSSDAVASLSGSANNGYQFIIGRGPEDALENQSFSISFNLKTSEVPPQPLPAESYGVTSNDEQVQDDSNFSVIFVNFETGSDFGYEANGQLEVTESNDNYLEGDFNFTTTSFTSGEEEVNVTGSFLAHIQ